MRRIRLAGAVGLVSLAALMFIQVPAAADEFATGSGSIGSAYAFSEYPQVNVDIDVLARCEVGGVSTASTPGATGRGFVSFGAGNSSCTTTTAGAAKVEVSGRRFSLEGLRAYGGPLIKIAKWSASCTTTESGSSSNISLSTVSGLQLPSTIPANHTIMIPGRLATDPPVAKIMINELLLPDPADGSMTVNLMHVWLFPEGVALAHGEVVVGTVHCAPFG
jgi:hypothetical protein